ncbi:MAG: glycosyltransferase [Nocardioides sp.]|nr:glycosyltransferase [Nocardioides sp.]
MTHPLDSFLANAPTPILIVTADNPVVAALPTGFDGSFLALSQVDRGAPVKRGWKSILLVASDRATLRQAASAIPRLGQCRTVGVWLTEGTSPLVLHPRGEWAPLSSLNARPLAQGFLTVARFDDPVGAHAVLAEFARQAVPGADATHGGVVVAYAGRPAAPGLDVRALHVGAVSDAGDADRDVPPDVVVSTSLDQPETHHVIDRAPTVVTDPGLDPVDELVFNAVGWRKDWDRPVIDLLKLAPGPAGVTEAIVDRARGHQGVRVDLVRDDANHVLRLAMAGVPLVATGTGIGLSPAVSEALSTTADLADPLSREEHALRLRRATFDHHSTLAWRSGLAARAGVRHAGLPAVSVLLATMRPQQLDFALGQVAAQRGADVELVLATHGFAADEEQVRAALGATPYVLLDFEKDAFFGDVLTAAARAASSEVLMKIDDDDWYSPHAVHDLLMARRFSGADVVGMPSEFVYLQQDDVTVRRNHPSECFNRFIAGGTIMIDRGMLRALGDFRRVRRFVDTQLLAGVEAAGGRIYRTHGLGYVLRRTGSGHTWAMDDDQFRRAEITETQWSGFHPGSEMRAAD